MLTNVSEVRTPSIIRVISGRILAAVKTEISHMPKLVPYPMKIAESWQTSFVSFSACCSTVHYNNRGNNTRLTIVAEDETKGGGTYLIYFTSRPVFLF
jgi:hypothetical protein